MANFSTALQNSPHLKAIVESAEKYVDAIDLSVVLMYLVDICPVEALPSLDSQFDVLGWKGWNLATTELEQRTLLKNAAYLHRYKGTPFSIKEALKSIGFGESVINEGSVVGVVRDGTFKYNGFLKHDVAYYHNWAFFNVVIDLGETKGITDEQVGVATELINEYKPARCILESLDFKCTVYDILTIEETFDLTIITA